MNYHTTSLEIAVNVHESVLSRKLVFWTSNWKHVINYDLYVKFPRIFAHSVEICVKFSCKNSLMFAQYFEYYGIILGRRFFVDTLYIRSQLTWTICRVGLVGLKWSLSFHSTRLLYSCIKSQLHERYAHLCKLITICFIINWGC